jgi:hypothetical protein
VDVSLLCFITLICSLNRILYGRPVWPMYSKEQSIYSTVVLFVVVVLYMFLYVIGGSVCYF